jgi:hypothetical protein
LLEAESTDLDSDALASTHNFPGWPSTPTGLLSKDLLVFIVHYFTKGFC